MCVGRRGAPATGDLAFGGTSHTHARLVPPLNRSRARLTEGWRAEGRAALSRRITPSGKELRSPAPPQHAVSRPVKPSPGWLELCHGLTRRTEGHGPDIGATSNPFLLTCDVLNPAAQASGRRLAFLPARRPRSSAREKKRVDPASHRPQQPGGGGGARGASSAVFYRFFCEAHLRSALVSLPFCLCHHPHWRSCTLPRGSSAPQPLHTPAPCLCLLAVQL